MVNSNSTGSCTNDNLTIKNLVLDGEIKTTFFTIKYTANDKNNSILRHFIYINGIKNEITKDVGYESTSNEFTYTLKNLNNNTLYSVQIEVSNSSSKKISNILNVTTRKSFVYGVRIDENNSNSETCCTYIEDAVDTQVANNTSLRGWANNFPFNKVKIVGFKDGRETGDINSENKDHYLGGVPVPKDVDVMTKLPKFYWKFTKVSNGYEIRISDTKLDGYDCFAHKVDGVEKDYIYIGCYEGYNRPNRKLGSRSGVRPSANSTLFQFRQYAQANGNGYQLFNYNTLKALQILYLIAYKNLNSQIALGAGNVSGTDKSTGETFDDGLIFGSQNKTQQMCFLGIESLWGNYSQFVDGICVNGINIHINEDNKNFNDNGNGYKVIPYQQKAINGYVSKVSGTNELGFYPSECRGSASTYYCDDSVYKSNTICRFGGNYRENDHSGIFSIKCDLVKSQTNASFGARLVYLG